jgi:hypothetical protein
MSAEEKKPDLIIDEDWKSQVERERADAEAKAKEDASQPAEASGPASGARAEADRGQMPPPTLSSLLTILGTQALMAMGQFRDPSQPEPPADFDQAEHFIELLGMLDEKTKGNRTTEESQLLDDLLYQLRMMFVQLRK